MTDPRTDPSAYLREAEEALEASAASGLGLKQQKEKELDISRRLEKLRSDISREKTREISSRRGSIETDFDRQLKSLDQDIRSASGRRQKARQEGVKKRIDDETSELRKSSESRKSELKKEMKDAGLPAYAGSRIYYSLFMPGSISEWLLAILCFALIFILLPWIIYIITPGEGMWKHMLIYVVLILGFGSLYIHISNRTRLRSPEALKKGRQMRSEISRDRRSIKKISRSIKRDRDDKPYDLGSFDDELRELQGKKQRLEEKKAEALKDFDNITRNVLSDEIDARHKDEISSLSAKLKEAENDRKELEQKHSDDEKLLSGFESELGRDNLSRERLRRLRELIDKKEASTLSEAVEKLHRQ